MPQKTTSRTPTETVLKLLVILLELRAAVSLTDLSKKLEVSKQSLRRYLERLDFSYFGELRIEMQGKEMFIRFEPYVKRIRREYKSFCKRNFAELASFYKTEKGKTREKRQEKRKKDGSNKPLPPAGKRKTNKEHYLF